MAAQLTGNIAGIIVREYAYIRFWRKAVLPDFQRSMSAQLSI
jgi:hypothetical protein